MKAPNYAYLLKSAFYRAERNIVANSYFPGGYFDEDGAVHYMHADYQGNIIAVTDSTGKVVQQTDYYPYGEPFTEPAGQPMLFGGKERTSTPDYRFGPRNLMSAALLWDAPDRKAHDYTRLSPLSFCAGNPIFFKDPDGNDIYIFDFDKKSIVVIPDDTFDAVDLVIEGNRYYGPSFKKGTIEGNQEIENSGNEHVGSGIQVNGDDETLDIYSFLCDNTNGEYSATLMGDEKNMVSTSFQRDTERTAKVVMLQAIDRKTQIRDHYHNHPKGTYEFSEGDVYVYDLITSHKGYEHVNFYLDVYLRNDFLPNLKLRRKYDIQK